MDALSTKYVEINGVMYQDNVVLENRTRRKVRSELYVKKDGTIFGLPIDDADFGPGDASMSLISRTVHTSVGPQNAYLAKGMRRATAADLKACDERVKANEARAAEIKRMKDPIEVEKEKAKIRAKENAEAVAAMVTAQGGRRRE